MKKLVVWLLILSLLLMASCKRMEEDAEGTLDLYIEDQQEEIKGSVDLDVTGEEGNEEVENETVSEAPSDTKGDQTEEKAMGNNEPSAEPSSDLNEEQSDNKETESGEPVADAEEKKPENNEEAMTEGTQTEEKKEKPQIMVTYQYVQKSPEQMQEEADLIIKGKAVKKVGQRMVNPDNTLTAPDGIPIGNRLVTEFEVEVLEIYKGSYDGKNVNVKFSCGSMLSPELILYGEDENGVLASKVKIPDMPIGEECILLLRTMDSPEQPEWTHGYYPFGPEGSYGYLKSDGKGSFKNNTYEACSMNVTEESLKTELAALEQENLTK